MNSSITMHISTISAHFLCWWVLLIFFQVVYTEGQRLYICCRTRKSSDHQAITGEENGETEPNMKAVVVLKMVIFVMLLGWYQTFASRPHFSGVMLFKNEHEPVKRNMRVEEPISVWWNEDYSHPRRRRPVHNKLDP